MASLQSRVFNIFLKLIRKKLFLKKQFDFGRFDFYDSPQPPKEIYDRCVVGKTAVRGRNVFVLKPKGNIGGKHILYLHGGAYVQNFVKQHWRFMANLVETLRCTVTAPDYPLAPLYTYKDSFEMVLPVYSKLVTEVPAGDLILMGDSAGGGFALALAQHCRIIGLPLPDKIFLLSPWLDLTLQNPAIAEIDDLDPFLGIEGLRKAGVAYAGESSRSDYLLSPIYGDVDGLENIHLFIGSRDILVADARKLRDQMREKGLHLNYYEYKDMIHVWMFLNFPESRKARQQIMRLIREPAV